MAKFINRKIDLKIDRTLLALLLIVFCGFFLIHDLLGGTLLSHCEWDSYTLQALAWRDGQFGLGQDYSWLELAIFNGDWYVSFPPVPTLVMLPLTFIFGQNTPNNFVMVVYALISVTIVYKCFRMRGAKEAYAAFWSAFAVLGSNLLWMSTNGGVWFQAQSLNFLLCAAAVHLALKDRRISSMALAALAVGCRPFSICLLPVLLIYFASEDVDKAGSWPRALLAQWRYIILPAVIGAVYLIFNYARFGNVLEFGHNYLPEFAEAKQFDPSYLPENLKNIFTPIGFRENLALDYPLFNGFLFFAANPFFIIFFARVIKQIAAHKMDAVKISICAGLLLNLIFLLMHKTFGGWQFGARYTVDLLPYAIMFVLLCGTAARPRRWERTIGILAIMFNAYGALAMTFINS